MLCTNCKKVFDACVCPDPPTPETPRGYWEGQIYRWAEVTGFADYCARWARVWGIK